MLSKNYPIDSVSCRRGAPMGRHGYGTVQSSEGKIRLFHVPLDSGGYDSGGAYWGLGTRLYCAWEPAEDGYLAFTRAGTREQAREKLEIPNDRLVVKTVVYRRGVI